ncbi:MAG: fumarylacetoacetate hydrolase family protein [Rhodospirillaceae bacterium]|nr:fumarylacetoacetate hydrolase family protein [Rhodospirillaceae bacterium]
MKLCRFNETRLGCVEGDTVLDVTAALDVIPAARWPLPACGDLLIRHLDAVRERVEEIRPEVTRVDPGRISLYSPVANPTKLLGAPVNYQTHIDEAEEDEGIVFDQNMIKPISESLCFQKAVSSLVGPGEGVVRSFPDRRTDHEVELAVVIGRETRGIPRERALDCVAGYAIGLDMTVRGGEDRSMRKSVDTYSVLGPWLTTADEIEDPNNLDLTLKLNGEIRQDSNTRHLIYDVQMLISKCSEFFTLLPGDVIYTGTPAGVGPVKPGDVLECGIQGIGMMRVPVR